jgi:putative peptidoglycan lipid II flippase
MGPTLVGMSLVQLNTMLDQVLANYLIDGEAPAFLYQANRLLLFPHALTSLALATAIFPQFAALGARGDLLGLRRKADVAMHHTLMIALPAAVGMMLVAQPLIDVMLGGSRVTGPDIDLAALTTLCLVASLPMIGVAQLHARAFYALGEYRTPAWMAFWLLLLNLVLDLVLVVGIGLGVYGFAIATTLAATTNAVVLRIRFRRRCPDPEAPAHGIWRTLLAVGVMAAVVAGLLAAVQAESRWQRVVYDLLIPVLGGVLSYAGLQFLFGRRTIRLR